MYEERLYKKYHKEYTEPRVLDRDLIYRLLGYLRPYAWWVALAIGMLLIAKCIEVFIPIYVGQMAQHIVNSMDTSSSHKEIIFNAILHCSLALIALLVFGYILDTLTVFLKSWIGQKVIHTLRNEVYTHIQHLPLEYYDCHAIGRLMTRTIHDVDQINQMFTESVIPLIGMAILFIGMCAGLLFIDWQAAIVFAGIVPVVGWLTYRFQYYQRYCFDIVRNIVSAMNSFAQEHLMGASTIRNFGLQHKTKGHFEELNEDHRLANMDTIHHFSFFISGIDFMQSLSLTLVFMTIVLFSQPGAGFQIGAFFTFSLYALMFFRPLVDLADRYNVLQSAVSAAERIFNILDQPIEPMEKLEEEVPEITHIEFENVWFAYEKENWVLKGLSFKIEKGESLAVVGVTGAGKSSIMSLLLRFYEFQKGSIKVNGKDIREYPLHALRRQFSVVLQDPVIFSGSVIDNITLFKADIPLEKVHESVDYVNLGMLINRYPDGLLHQLTERGQSLSMGEMQLISLARAITHPHSVLILDEATASIDTVTEQLLQDALKKILKDKTALVIAHRLSTIRDATRILVLHNGVVAETGTHDELLALRGIYEKLYRVQFS